MKSISFYFFFSQTPRFHHFLSLFERFGVHVIYYYLAPFSININEARRTFVFNSLHDQLKLLRSEIFQFLAEFNSFLSGDFLFFILIHFVSLN